MFARPCAAARMMGDFDQWQFRQTKKFRFGPRQLHKDRLAQSHRRLSLLLQFDSVVDTPRCTRPSSAETSNDRVTPVQNFLHHWRRRALHVRRLGSENNFPGIEFSLQQLGQLLKHARRVGLTVVDDSDNFSLERVQSRYQRPITGIDARARI